MPITLLRSAHQPPLSRIGGSDGAPKVVAFVGLGARADVHGAVSALLSTASTVVHLPSVPLLDASGRDIAAQLAASSASAVAAAAVTPGALGGGGGVTRAGPLSISAASSAADATFAALCVRSDEAVAAATAVFASARGARLTLLAPAVNPCNSSGGGGGLGRSVTAAMAVARLADVIVFVLPMGGEQEDAVDAVRYELGRGALFQEGGGGGGGGPPPPGGPARLWLLNNCCGK